MQLPLLSIVCPAFQEEEVLAPFHDKLAEVLAGLEAEFRAEVIYVDDGSTDQTLAVLQRLAAQDQRVRYFSLSRNFGHQAALTAGLEQARGEVIVSMDSDLQHPPEIIPTLLAQWRAGHDVVLTIRADDERLGLMKRLTSKMFYRVMARLSDTDIRTGASDFRLTSRKALVALLRLKEQHRFLRGMARWVGFSSAEVHFRPAQRKAGKTKYTFRRMARLAGDGLFSFSTAPLRLAGYLGALVLLFAALHALGCMIAWALGASAAAPHWSYLLVAGEFLGGAILFCLGVIGEYVGRIFEQVKGRPVYLIKDRSPEVVPAAATMQERGAA